jgi:hypothetical protein
MLSGIAGALVVQSKSFEPYQSWTSTGTPYLSDWGAFRLWDPDLPYADVLGVYGLIGFALALPLFRKYPLISALTLAPLLYMLFPPFALLFSIGVAHERQNGWVTYRAFYAFPTAVLLILGIKEGLEFLARHGAAWLGPPRRILASAAILTLLLSVPYTAPYRGRLAFQLYRPPAALSLTGLDETARWLANHDPIPPYTTLLSDDATYDALACHLGLPLSYRRMVRFAYFDANEVLEGRPLDEVIRNEGVGAVLVALPGRRPAPPFSWVGYQSGHWDPWTVRRLLSVDARTAERYDSLTRRGWTRRSVPPGYQLYLPPPEATAHKP